jgi:predicted component of type VI protein secretion system
MTLNTLLTFIVISQIVMAAYLLYSFNTIERASKRRHDALAAHIDQALVRMEARLSGTPLPRARAKAAAQNPAEKETALLRPREA